MNYRNRFIYCPKSSFFLFGPRGTGKSMWVEHHFGKDALQINLLDPATCRTFLAKPEHLKSIVEGSPKKTVVIDEVQHAPQLLSVVHQLLEEQKELRFVLTGSCSRKLKRTGMDMLAGRAAVSMAHPFMAAEMGSPFDIELALRFGMLPLVRESAAPNETLGAYVMLYVREELMAEALLRDAGGFTRFLEAISFSHGSLLNVSEVARECEVSRKTVESYVGVLDDMLLGCRLPVFSRRAKRQLIKQTKFYFADCGVFASLRPKGPLDRPQEIHGAALEGLVFQHLRAWLDYSGGADRLYFWRTKSGVEVDFILYGPGHFCAIEVKNSAKVQRKDLSALQAFRSDYPECRAMLLHRGTDTLVVDGIPCVPCQQFLERLIPGKPLP
jgi:uncharacterized protein